MKWEKPIEPYSFARVQDNIEGHSNRRFVTMDRAGTPQ
jgi:hypothetical protein